MCIPRSRTTGGGAGIPSTNFRPSPHGSFHCQRAGIASPRLPAGTSGALLVHRGRRPAKSRVATTVTRSRRSTCLCSLGPLGPPAAAARNSSVTIVSTHCQLKAFKHPGRPCHAPLWPLPLAAHRNDMGDNGSFVQGRQNDHHLSFRATSGRCAPRPLAEHALWQAPSEFAGGNISHTHTAPPMPLPKCPPAAAT